MARRKRTITLREFLAEHGIRTNLDLYGWCSRNAKPGESRYGTMSRLWGESTADKVMRQVEIAECHTSLNPR